MGQPWPLDRALEHAELMPQSEDLDGELAAGLEEAEGYEDYGTEEVWPGGAAWSGRSRTSTISPWSEFSGATAICLDLALVSCYTKVVEHEARQ